MDFTMMSESEIREFLSEKGIPTENESERNALLQLAARQIVYSESIQDSMPPSLGRLKDSVEDALRMRYKNKKECFSYTGNSKN